MNNKCKKIFGGILATTLLGATLLTAACGGVYEGDKLDYTTPETKAVSNGGFAVEYGDYVYFINGMENYTAENEYGEVVKGALMRMKKTDLNGDVASAGYNKAETVVPMLFVAQNFTSGIYIYGDYVYFATPTTAKDENGEVVNSSIDFKRAKLDGSETMKDYYFRLEDNTSYYRFVEQDGTVYCLYEYTTEAGVKQLKSYNTSTEEDVVLVASAQSAFMYDMKDLTNPNVYYTMSVAPDAEAPNPPPAASYNQVYCVNAAAKVESVDEEEASYTVKGGKTYDFNQAYMQEKNDEAEENDEEEVPFDFEDYTTYPYVNLGNLVLDGIGDDTVDEKTQFNEQKEADPTPYAGYKYELKSAQNGGVYFTRTEVFNPGSTSVDTSLYYLADVKGDWNAISDNAKAEKVAEDTTNTGAALFYKNAENKHEYLYVSSEGDLYRATAGKADPVRLAKSVGSSVTLYKTEGDYLYYYATDSGTKNTLSRIIYNGADSKYDNLLGLAEEAYKPVTVSYLRWDSSWYKPEIFGDVVLYSNAKEVAGTSAYNYVYAAKLDDIKGLNEKYGEVADEISGYDNDSALENLLDYYFMTGETGAYEDVKDLYNETQQKEFDKFVQNVKDGKFGLESSFVALIGEVKADDKDTMAEDWADYLLKEEVVEEEEEGLPTWAIILISVGGFLVLVAAWKYVRSRKAKKARRREAEATVNAYKRKKIDTTDDKSIDVYADDEESVEENTEVVETVETVEETPVEEVTEAPAEEVVEATEADAKEEE